MKKAFIKIEKSETSDYIFVWTLYSGNGHAIAITNKWWTDKNACRKAATRAAKTLKISIKEN
jgi:hypothetical protein